MPPAGVARAGDPVTAPDERVIRRGRRKGKQRYVLDQVTGKYRPPFWVFEPRLPETKENAQKTDKYLSVNIVSSLLGEGLPLDWRGNDENFYSAQTSVAACNALALHITWEPILGNEDPEDDNPHHGGIRGVVELFYRDRDAYDSTLTRLAKSTEVLPECIP